MLVRVGRDTTYRDPTHPLTGRTHVHRAAYSFPPFVFKREIKNGQTHPQHWGNLTVASPTKKKASVATDFFFFRLIFPLFSLYPSLCCAP